MDKVRLLDQMQHWQDEIPFFSPSEFWNASADWSQISAFLIFSFIIHVQHALLQSKIIAHNVKLIHLKIMCRPTMHYLINCKLQHKITY